VFHSLVAGGVWDANGHRQASVEEAAALVEMADLPDSVQPERGEIVNQCALVLAIHQMRGDVKVPVSDFFDAHRSGGAR